MGKTEEEVKLREAAALWTEVAEGDRLKRETASTARPSRVFSCALPLSGECLRIRVVFVDPTESPRRESPGPRKAQARSQRIHVGRSRLEARRALTGLLCLGSGRSHAELPPPAHLYPLPYTRLLVSVWPRCGPRYGQTCKGGC
jgi:hypothetical protein